MSKKSNVVCYWELWPNTVFCDRARAKMEILAWILLTDRITRPEGRDESLI